MEFTNLQELYQMLIPAFKVKKRLLSITNYNTLTFEDIWQHLAIHKWKSSVNLSLADMVNDIIMFDANSIKYL